MNAPVYQDARHVIAVCENTVVTYSDDAPNPRFLDAWTRTVEEVAGQFPTGLQAMTIIDSRVRAPDDDSRVRIRETVMRHANELKAFAYVVEGEGFGAAALRGAISLISLAARYPFPMKVFGHVAEAAPWMLNRANQGTKRSSAAKLVSVASSLRGELQNAAKAG